MLIGALTIQINLHGINSLKDKRSIVKSLTNRLRNRFDFSVAEVSAHESRNIAVIGIAMVSNDAVYIQKQLDKANDFIRRDGRFFVGTTETETFSC